MCSSSFRLRVLASVAATAALTLVTLEAVWKTVLEELQLEHFGLGGVLILFEEYVPLAYPCQKAGKTVTMATFFRWKMTRAFQRGRCTWLVFILLKMSSFNIS